MPVAGLLHVMLVGEAAGGRLRGSRWYHVCKVTGKAAWDVRLQASMVRQQNLAQCLLVQIIDQNLEERHLCDGISLGHPADGYP